MLYREYTQKYGRWEITCNSTATMVTITSPSGMTENIETFIRTPGKLIYDIHGYEAIVPDGEAYRCARYTPREAGRYTFSTDDGESGWFIAEDVGNHGYVEVGKKDPRYFAFTDGTPFAVIGTNLAMLTANTLSGNREFSLTNDRGYLGVREYERWFKKLSNAGGNHARIWVGQEYLNPDTEDPRVFDLLQFEKLDAIVELARKYGIYLKLTFEQFRFFGDSIYGGAYGENLIRLFGKQYTLDGQSCASMTEWVNGENWRKLWIEKIRLYMRRYAGDPVIMVFELWNEMNAVEAPYDDVLAWNRYMAKALRPLAPYNMWSQSLGSMDSEPNTEIYRKFPFTDFCFSQFHRYLDQGAPFEICRENGFALTKAGLDVARVPDMPVILAETGAVNDCHSGMFRYYACDDRGIIFADTVYPAFFLGSAGCGQIWHWGVYVETKNLFPMLKPLSEAVSGVMLEDEEFEVHDLSDETVWAAVLVGEHTVLGLVRNKADSWYTVLRDGNEPEPLPDYCLHLETPGELKLYPIWNDETANAFLYDGNLELRNMKYGLMFRINRDI